MQKQKGDLAARNSKFNGFVIDFSIIFITIYLAVFLSSKLKEIDRAVYLKKLSVYALDYMGVSSSRTNVDFFTTIINIDVVELSILFVVFMVAIAGRVRYKQWSNSIALYFLVYFTNRPVFLMIRQKAGNHFTIEAEELTNTKLHPFLVGLKTNIIFGLIALLFLLVLLISKKIRLKELVLPLVMVVLLQVGFVIYIKLQ